MPVHNADIAAVFSEIADLLEIELANPFRIRAYRNAARMVAELGRDVRAMIARGEDLRELPGIGDDLAAKMREIVETGHCRALDKLHAELPPVIGELLHVPGLGPKRVRALWHDLDVETPGQLARAAREGRIRDLPGFGAKSEANILSAVEAHLTKERRLKLAIASQYARALAAWIAAGRGVTRVEVVGSYRRMRETVGDLDILVAAEAGNDVMARFTAYDEVARVLSAGTTRSSVLLRSGLQVDLRLVEAASWGAALCYFTGSRSRLLIERVQITNEGLENKWHDLGWRDLVGEMRPNAIGAELLAQEREAA
jgi:DNA polymerase (family 10)